MAQSWLEHFQEGCLKCFEGANLSPGVINRTQAIPSNNFGMLSLGPIRSRTHSSTPPKVRVPHEAQNDGTLLVGKAPEVLSGAIAGGRISIVVKVKSKMNGHWIIYGYP